MKGFVLISLLLFAFACRGGGGSNLVGSGEVSNGDALGAADLTAKVYACEMGCEGDKTYSEAGVCPVSGCGMALQAVSVEEDKEAPEASAADGDPTTDGDGAVGSSSSDDADVADDKADNGSAN